MRALKALALLPLAALSACYGEIPKDDPRYAEMQDHNVWLKQLKAEDPDTAKLIADQCYAEGGSLWTSEGVLKISRCMRRKYDEGVRA